MKRKFSQFNETDSLKTVIIGRWQGFHKVEEYTNILDDGNKNDYPTVEQLKTEFQEFQQALERNNVEVLIPEYIGKFVYDQLTPRDVATVIRDKLILCNMAKRSRKYEVAGIFPLIRDFSGDEPDILIPPVECLLEGGDVMVDKGRILVGLSRRTNLKGYEWLLNVFGDEMRVIPLYLTDLKEEENVLHLDCTFNPVGENCALIYEEGLKPIPDFLEKDYDLIKISRDEQQALATNVFSISSTKVIARDHPQSKRVVKEMKNRGIDVEEIKFDGAPSTGGSFRCCTLPLIRD
ncbi:dimethylarginine dimethylaminohydrolase family protein [soil metagenome]